MILFPFLSLSARSTQTVNGVTSLEPGQAIKRELAGGQRHSYRIRLNADQFLKVAVEQIGVDVAV
ncbi:MAG: hypothetical protein J2P41_08380, partial [Blastocatellia bacterium]|nr:hypothetical protein [Blastocatellia bacterium]